MSIREVQIPYDLTHEEFKKQNKRAKRETNQKQTLTTDNILMVTRVCAGGGRGLNRRWKFRSTLAVMSHWVMYGILESFYRTPETNTAPCVN